MNILQAIKRGLKTTDKLLMSLCLLTSLFGVLMVYSATYSSLEDGSLISRTALVMLLAVIVGVAMCIVISFIDYEIVLRFWMIIGGVCLLMMLLLFPFGSGTADRPDARTWFDFKVINFQPSELFKIAFIITFAVHLDYVGEDINKLKNALLLCVHGGVPALLVILTGDLGSALVFVSIFIGMMFASGLAARYFAAAGAMIVAAVPILWFAFFSDFQKGRILAVYAPSKLDTALYKKYIFQQQQSVNAIGSGRFFGRGFLKGAYTQSHSVPVNDSDMIFSVIGEELGFVGAFAALTLIGFLSVKSMLKGTAADALRPYSPKKMKRMAIEKGKLWQKLSFGTKWNMRDVARHKSRTLMSVIGVLGCAIILVGSLGMNDTMNAFLNDYYDLLLFYINHLNH